jgi:hypothetical protein
MHDERYKQLMEQVGMPNSRSLLMALKQVANEVAQQEQKKTIKSLSDIQMLMALIQRGKIQEAPKKITFAVPHSTILIGIGKDHFADVIIDNDAIEELEKLVREES